MNRNNNNNKQIQFRMLDHRIILKLFILQFAIGFLT